MESLAILSFNCLLIIAIWFCLWKPAIKSRNRAVLYEIKKETTSFFLKNYSLEHPIYKRLIANIEGTMKALDEISFISYIAWDIEVNKNPELVDHFRKNIDRRYKTTDQQLTDFIKDVRQKCIFVGIDHMVKSSIFLQISFLAITTIIAIKALFKYGQVTLKNAVSQSQTFTQNKIEPIFVEGLSSKL